MEEILKSEPKMEEKRSKFPLVMVGLTGGIAVGITIIAAPFVAPALRKHCLPYLPATTEQLKNVAAALKKCDKAKPLVDLGSGDGRIVLEAAKAGFKAHGVELNPWLVLYSRLSAMSQGKLSKQMSFSKQDLWKMNFRPYGTVVIFGVGEMMAPLATKFTSEMDPSSHVVACRFAIPDWTAHAVVGEGNDTVWLYKISDNQPSQS